MIFYYLLNSNIHDLNTGAYFSFMFKISAICNLCKFAHLKHKSFRMTNEICLISSKLSEIQVHHYNDVEQEFHLNKC